VSSVFRESIPYLAVLTVVLMIVTYVPAVSLWLPRLLMPT
jgi:TRAP-type C4-dicarboxylate transport system permease large subunit